MDAALIALIGTIFGGVGLKVVEAIMSRGSDKDQTAHQIRQELRGDLQGIRTEMIRVQDELDEWKAKYYALLEQLITVKSELEGYTRLAKSNIVRAGNNIHDAERAMEQIPEDDRDAQEKS
jgi:uncharacterized protein involved in exopolysaccharide biosynthesis